VRASRSPPCVSPVSRAMSGGFSNDSKYRLTPLLPFPKGFVPRSRINRDLKSDCREPPALGEGKFRCPPYGFLRLRKERHIKRAGIIGALAFGVALSSGAFARAQPAPKNDVPADLAKEAKVSLEDARKTALAAVPGGKIKSEELEREKGKLVYSFDIKVGKKSGVEEVGIDAMTGKIIEKKHETAKSEKAEKKADRKKS
jgi:hypothetical protein